MPLAHELVGQDGNDAFGTPYSFGGTLSLSGATCAIFSRPSGPKRIARCSPDSGASDVPLTAELRPEGRGRADQARARVLSALSSLRSLRTRSRARG